jgi:hypothetical protein
MEVKCWLIGYCKGGIIDKRVLVPDTQDAKCPMKDCPRHREQDAAFPEMKWQNLSVESS